MFGGAFSGFGGQLFGNWRFRPKRRFQARVDPLAFWRFWAFLENFEGATGLEPPLFPLLHKNQEAPPGQFFALYKDTRVFGCAG